MNLNAHFTLFFSINFISVACLTLGTGHLNNKKKKTTNESTKRHTIKLIYFLSTD